MPQPQTIIDAVTGSPLVTFDGQGDVYAAGAVLGYGSPSGKGPGAVVAAPVNGPPLTSDIMGQGDAILDRAVGGASTSVLVSGTAVLSYFTARTSAPCSSVWTAAGGTAAAGLTTAQVGVYGLDGQGNATLLAASVANVAALWTGTFNQYQTQLTSVFQRAAGQRYALAVLAAGTTMPQLAGSFGQFLNLPPQRSAALAVGAALPAVISGASLAGTSPGYVVQGIFVP